MAAIRKKRAQKRERVVATRKLPTDVKTPGCILPTTPSDESIRAVVIGRSKHKERAIVEYVEWQLGKKTTVHVRHLELLLSETVHGSDHELWDVHTSDGRWWVVTEPMSVYPQDAFPSADYMLSFHIGLTARLAHRLHRSAEENAFTARFAGAYRRWEQAAQALDSAKESEDLQAIGVKCRECLVTLTRDAQAGIAVPVGTERPKGADFKGWAELIANWALVGPSVADLRAHLKSVATTTWQLANWLTHTRNASKGDANLTVSAVRHLLDAFAAAFVRKEAKQPDKCPNCSSYQIDSVYVPELERDPPYILLCQACDWNDEPAEGI